jgi:hypothetical protein
MLPTPAHNGNNLLDAALAYAARGWCIIPTREKKAAGKWRQFQSAPPDETTLRRLFAGWNVDGLAVLLGPASGGLVARDFDSTASYNQWAVSRPQLAATLPTVKTARGRHIYFRGPEGFKDFGDGEYRGDAKHYCLLPPSRHPSGSVYAWLICLPPGELPTIDPHEAGLWSATERTERTHLTERNREHRADRAPLVSSLPSAPSLLQTVSTAIVSTLPTMQGQRTRKLFALARRLKAIPSLASAEAPTLRPIILEWHRQALSIIKTKEFLETWADFLQAWRRVKVPADQDPIDTAFERAVASVPPRHVTELYGEGPIVLLAALCRELQQVVGDGEFFLDCRTAGRLIRVEHTTAWRYLDVLCADGILAAGAKGSKATRKASRFRFLDLE